MKKIKIRGSRESDDSAFDGDYLRGEFWAPRLEPVALQFSSSFLTRNDAPLQHILVATQDEQPAAKIIVFDVDIYAAAGFVQVCLAAGKVLECPDTCIELGEAIKTSLHRDLGLKTLAAFALDGIGGSTEMLERLGFDWQLNLPRHAIWKGMEHSRGLWIHRKEKYHEHD